MMPASSKGLPIALGVLFWGAQAASAAVVEVVQRSEPSGIVSQSTMVDTPTNFATQVAPPKSTSYCFTHWTINGSRTNDFSGRALNPARFAVYEAIDAAANYLSATADADVDGVPDWYEIHFCGDLAQAAGADADADGLPLGLQLTGRREEDEMLFGHARLIEQALTR